MKCGSFRGSFRGSFLFGANEDQFNVLSRRAKEKDMAYLISII